MFASREKGGGRGTTYLCTSSTIRRNRSHHRRDGSGAYRTGRKAKAMYYYVLVELSAILVLQSCALCRSYAVLILPQLPYSFYIIHLVACTVFNFLNA